jgi:hypothetical protein
VPGVRSERGNPGSDNGLRRWSYCRSNQAAKQNSAEGAPYEDPGEEGAGSDLLTAEKNKEEQ